MCPNLNDIINSLPNLIKKSQTPKLHCLEDAPVDLSGLLKTSGWTNCSVFVGYSVSWPPLSLTSVVLWSAWRVTPFAWRLWVTVVLRWWPLLCMAFKGHWVQLSSLVFYGFANVVYLILWIPLNIMLPCANDIFRAGCDNPLWPLKVTVSISKRLKYL